MRRTSGYKMISGLAVEVRDGKFERALRQFNKKVQNSGIIKEMRDRRYFEKPSETKKIKKKIARKRLLKKMHTEDSLHKRDY